MNTNTILVVALALLIGGISGYMLSGNIHSESELGMASHHHTEEIVPEHTDRMPDGSRVDRDAVMGHMGEHNDHMMDMMVTSERAFITHMIPHHQEAVETAEEVLERGATTPEMYDLATQIIAAQEQEIIMMKTWYEDWYGEPYVGTDEYVPMMRDLSTLSGAALDRTFLEDMIVHHMGAIMMARSVQPYIEHSEVQDLTEAIIVTQSAEIRDMRTILSEL